MTLFDWIQAGIDVVVVAMVGLHGHPIHWRRR